MTLPLYDQHHKIYLYNKQHTIHLYNQHRIIYLYNQQRIISHFCSISQAVFVACLSDLFIFLTAVHTEKSFRNLIKSTRNQIVFTIFRLIWNQTDVHLVQIHRCMVYTILFGFD